MAVKKTPRVPKVSYPSRGARASREDYVGHGVANRVDARSRRANHPSSVSVGRPGDSAVRCARRGRHDLKKPIVMTRARGEGPEKYQKVSSAFSSPYKQIARSRDCRIGLIRRAHVDAAILRCLNNRPTVCGQVVEDGENSFDREPVDPGLERR
jgi:hypothetical protein